MGERQRLIGELYVGTGFAGQILNSDLCIAGVTFPIAVQVDAHGKVKITNAVLIDSFANSERPIDHRIAADFLGLIHSVAPSKVESLYESLNKIDGFIKRYLKRRKNEEVRKHSRGIPWSTARHLRKLRPQVKSKRYVCQRKTRLHVQNR